MLKKALSVVLLSSMLLGTVAPAVSYAQEDKLEIVQGAELMKQKFTKDKSNQFKTKLTQSKLKEKTKKKWLTNSTKLLLKLAKK